LTNTAWMKCGPAYHIKEIFEVGSCRDSYVKPLDAGKILRENVLSVTINQCAEFVGTIVSLSGGDVDPYLGGSF
jgi:hypothetical protein